MPSTCGRPFYKYLAEAANGNADALFNWVTCPYAATGIGMTGFGMLFIGIVGIGLLNWSENFTVPVVWMTLMSGVLVAVAPGPLLSRMFGLIVGGIAMLFVGLIFYLR